MFSKKCPGCSNKINKKYDFCPFCGTNFSSEQDREDYGFLGKNDFTENIEREMFSETEDSFMDKMMENAFKMAEKMLEKQMKNLSKEMVENQSRPRIQTNNQGNVDIQFFVNGKRVFPQISNQAQQQAIEEPAIPIRTNRITEEKAERFSKLPKKEPKSRVRRLSGKIIYELEVPGVKNIDDVLINQLENSIEIKALSKDKVYSKTLNINLPVLNYKLSNDNLVIELMG